MISHQLSAVRRYLIAKSSEVGTELRNWATWRAAFLSEALGKYDLISTEPNADFTPLISLD